MANLNSISQPSKLTNHTSGLHFKFIDEQERIRNPNSHLRTIVRSHAKRNAHSKRREPPKLRQLACAVRPTTRTPHSSQNLLLQSNSHQNRVRRFWECRAGLPELPQNPNSQGGPLSTWSREFGRQYQGQGRIAPQTMLGAGRIDPFDSFPVKMEFYMHSLVDHYTSVCAYILPKEDNGVTSMHTKWVPLCILNVMGFKSMLLSAEISIRGKAGLNPWCLRSIGAMGEILELLRQELNKPKPDLSDTMVVAIINITCIELVWGEREKYRHHIEGLQRIYRIRREENRRLSSFLEGMINWVHQLGGEIVASGVDGRNRFTAIPDHQDFTDNLPASHGSSPVSQEVVEILKSIRFLTTTHNALDADFFKTISDDYRATCKSIIHRLQSLYSKTAATSNLQDMCILAACVYIDITLLRSPSSQYISQKELSQLQRALTEANSFWEKRNNKDLFTWISGTANTVLADGDNNPNRVFILVSNFDTVLRRLEGSSIG